MYPILALSELFSGLEPAAIAALLEACEVEVRNYSGGDIIALQGSRYNDLLLLVEGSVRAESGEAGEKRVHLEQIAAPAMIAPSFLYARGGELPATLIARNAVTIIAIPRRSFSELLAADRRVMENFLQVVSTANKFVSEKVVYLTYKTIKGRLANYLLTLSGEQGVSTVVNPLTQREMAAMFSVTRPALARALGELAAEGTIYVKNKRITLVFAEKLRQYTRK